jgi:hypothetical protein
MRRLIATLVLAAGLVAGAIGATPADAAPDVPTHSVSISQQINICQYLDPGPEWDRVAQRHLHYGSADVVQCAYRFTSTSGQAHYTCAQYVWNAPGAWSEKYLPVDNTWPYCW